MLISLCANEQGLSIRGSEIFQKLLWLECRVIHCDSSRVILWKTWLELSPSHQKPWLESSHWLESRCHCVVLSLVVYWWDAMAGLATCFHQNNQTLSQKNQIAVLRHIYSLHIKHSIPNTKKILKFIRKIDIIQFQSLEAFSLPVNTLSHICFLSNTSNIFKATLKCFPFTTRPA